MGVEEAVLGLAEGERESVENVVGAEPDVLAALGPNLRPELTETTDEAVGSVGADYEVGVGQFLDFDTELELGAELAAARLQDLEQPLARDRGEGVTPRAQLAPAEPDVDPIPARECVGDLEMRLWVRVAQRAERLLAEDDAEAERRVRRVALEHANVDAAIGLAQEDREIEPCWAAADDLDLHASASSSRLSSSASATVGKSTSSSQPASSYPRMKSFTARALVRFPAAIFSANGPVNA